MTTSFSQISKKRQDAMDSLSKDELIFEIKRGRESRFSRTLAYLEYRLQKINEEEEGNARQEGVAIAREANYLSKEANQFSANANRLSKWAIGIAIAAFIVSLGALGYEIYKSKNPNNSLNPDAQNAHAA